MSHATVSFVPLIAPAFIPVIVVGAAGFAVTTGAVLAARKFHADFEQACCDFEAREREREAEREINRAAYSLVRRSAAHLGAAAEVDASFCGSADFLAFNLQKLLEQARGRGYEELKTKAEELLETSSSGKASDHLAAYFALVKEYDACLTHEGEVPSEEVRVLVESVKAQIEDPIWQHSRFQPLRLELGAQLARIESVPEANQKLKLQGLSNLKDRIYRELAAYVEVEEKLESEKLTRREVVGKAVAMMRAVAQAPGSPEESAKAQGMLNEIAVALQNSTGFSELEGLHAKSRALFELCEKRLNQTANQAYLSESIQDALVSMGYKVSEVPPEAKAKDGYMVSVDHETGMVINVDEQGQILTEMVAFDESARMPSSESEEKVCQLVDRIYESLRDRRIDVKEKTRRHLKLGHRVPVVKRPREELVAAVAAKPKARTVE